MGDERQSGLKREIGLLDATMIVISIINILGVKPRTRTTTLLTAIKVTGFGVLIVGGLVMPFTPAPTTFVSTTPLLAGFAAALVPISFSFGGWQQLNFVAGEIREAQRKVPIALALGVAIVAAIYIGANAVYLKAKISDKKGPQRKRCSPFLNSANSARTQILES